MDPFHFVCPHCSSRLRVREKLYVGRQVECPECGQALKIVEGIDGLEAESIARKTAAAPGKEQRQKAAFREKPADTPAESQRSGVLAGASATRPPQAAPAGAVQPEACAPALPIWRRRSAWAGAALAVVVTIVGVLILLRNGATPRDEAKPGPELAVDQADETQQEPHSEAKSLEKPRSELERRLSNIGEALLEAADLERAFPSGTAATKGLAPQQRLSWLAELVDQFDDDAVAGGGAHWELPWNDPRNENFVRRRLKAFQNPAVRQLTGADGYPASHFVGCTGVGSDAAKLAGTDARAGIFGYDRRTRLDEIPDGAANTLLVLGVQDQLGSWAAGGAATVRGLTREPYVNGPDGFGTGSSDSMQVLMADGRVITLSAQTDPRILRRMAAKADGLPLDESEPGEPGDRPSLLALRDGDASEHPDGQESDEGPATRIAEANSSPAKIDGDNLPLEPEFAPEPAAAQPKIDLNVSLKQPIAKFDQPKSKPLSEVLASVAEMAGARIAYDRDELGPAAARLSEPVALKLENTTIGEILAGLLRSAGLDFQIDGDHLKLVPQSDTDRE